MFLFSFETGVRSALTSNWVHERKIRIVSQSLFLFSIIVFHLQLFEAWKEKKDVSLIIMEFTKVTGITISFLRMVAAAMLIKPITTLRRFVSSHTFNSGDAKYDECEQNKFNRFSRKAIQTMFVWITVDTILLFMPSSIKDELFQYPLPSFWIGKKASRILNRFLVSFIPATIFPKTISCTAYIGVILIGMRTKLRLLAHRFEMIAQKLAVNEDQDYEGIRRELRQVLIQHQKYLRFG